MCGAPPLPLEEKLYLPGLARITLTNSCTELAGTCDDLISTSGRKAMREIGAKSRITSKGTFICAGLAVRLVDVYSNV